MHKKTNASDRTKKRKTGRKLLDLPIKPVKGGDAASINGGFCDGSVRFNRITDGTSNT